MTSATKRARVILEAALASGILLWMVGSFIAWNCDPGTWSEEGRLAIGFGWALGSLITAGIILEVA